jgi:hypothetical protein
MTRFGAIVVLLAALGAPLVAAVNVPDPTWVAGLYDGADGDEAVIALDNAPAVSSGCPLVEPPRAAVLDGRPLVLVSRTAPPVTPSSRAPPLA